MFGAVLAAVTKCWDTADAVSSRVNLLASRLRVWESLRMPADGAASTQRCRHVEGAWYCVSDGLGELGVHAPPAMRKSWSVGRCSRRYTATHVPSGSTSASLPQKKCDLDSRIVFYARLPQQELNVSKLWYPKSVPNSGPKNRPEKSASVYPNPATMRHASL